MLYIFHVDTGTTITFEIKLAMQSVADLKEAIERECGVVAHQQVLLMSGGESLEPHVRVCSYSAGTDTNPIYLFSKAAIEKNEAPVPSIDYGSDVDLNCQITASLQMPATYQTLVARAQLAQQCCGLAREQLRICERLIHDQHLQQQGWAAVVANLEDITLSFKQRAETLQQNFSLYLAERPQHMELLQNFNADLRTLEKIPILPALRAQAEGLLSPDEQPNYDSSEVISLLKWISAKDNQSSLEQVAEQCSRGLEQFDERVMESLKAEVAVAVDTANKQEMKEIKGLEERLYSLEQLMVQIKKHVQEQGELAQGFQLNQNRVTAVGDESVLPDLCISHRKQLMVMLQNHNHLRDIRKRCTKAKEELSVNIYHRLKWIMYVENKMIEVDGKLVMYHESLRRLRRHLEVLQQIHLAPQMYVNAIAEVVRRRTFSQAFLVWASTLACQLLTVHSEEIAKRREFGSKFEGHFLNTLFPGLEDTPPPYATQAPSVFDNGLPKLTADDMESLREQLPDMALSLSTPDLNSITQFFFSKSLTECSSDGNKDKDSISMRVDPPTKEQEQSRPLLLGERAGFESETDTEEFEKIGQAAVDSKLVSFEASQQRQKQLEENLGNTRDELERLRNVIKNMKSVASDALAAFREELNVLRNDSVEDRTQFTAMTDRIKDAIKVHSSECERTLREREQVLTVAHELELAELKKLLESRDEELRSLKKIIDEKGAESLEHQNLIRAMSQKLKGESEELKNVQARFHQQMEEVMMNTKIDEENPLEDTNSEMMVDTASLTNSLNQCRGRISELEKELSEVGIEKERAVKEATEKLQAEYDYYSSCYKVQISAYKDEVKSLRDLFMSDSVYQGLVQSDISLDKTERSDVFDTGKGNIVEPSGDTKPDKDAEASCAVESSREELIKALKIAKQIIDDREMDVKLYQRREGALIEQCKRYETMIAELSQTENQTRSIYEGKIESLKQNNAHLKDKITANQKLMEQKDSQVHDLEVERNGLRQELNDERLKMSQTGLEEARLNDLDTESEDARASESKKVRLEANDDPSCLASRLQILQNDNNRLTAELRTSWEGKKKAEAKVEILEADKERLEVELRKERIFIKLLVNESMTGTSSVFVENRDKDMNASVALVSDSSVAKSPQEIKKEIMASITSTSSTSSSSSKHTRDLHLGRINISGCNTGDIVIVLWDPVHRNYIVLQESTTYYFLTSDCIGELNLKMDSDGVPRKSYVLAEVVEKEYCQTKKPENRYRVPQGTKFYRVRVKPTQRLARSVFSKTH